MGIPPLAPGVVTNLDLDVAERVVHVANALESCKKGGDVPVTFKPTGICNLLGL